MSEQKIKELEARLKSLEDWQQGLARAIVAAPQPKPQDFLGSELVKAKSYASFPSEKPEVKSQLQHKDAYDKFPAVARDYIKQVTDEGDVWIVKLQFIGGEKFKEVAAAMKGVGGEFVSAGKDSHWRVKK